MISAWNFSLVISFKSYVRNLLIDKSQRKYQCAQSVQTCTVVNRKIYANPLESALVETKKWFPIVHTPSARCSKHRSKAAAQHHAIDSIGEADAKRNRSKDLGLGVSADRFSGR